MKALLLLPLLLLTAAAERREDAFITYSEKKIVGCRDKNANCDSWATAGECQKNVKFMLESCPVACKDCTPAELNVANFLDEVVVFQTKFGEIRIIPDFENAPRTCALVLDLAHQATCDGCNFYRAELAPSAKQGDGPPYGLLQGSLAGLLKSPPHEGSIEVKYGDVAMITGAEFYIAAVDHPGWGSAHSVWGRIANMSVVDRILAEPYHEFKHPSAGTVMRLMNKNVAFKPVAAKLAGRGRARRLASD